MFARIAPRYDRANHLLSMGVDRLWRRAAVRYADLVSGARVLDVCAGTGDLSLALARAGARVTGSDFCLEMLSQAHTKSEACGPDARPRYVLADAQQLPFPNAGFDAVTVAFGIRNVSDAVTALAEMRRVVRPGGCVIVLEFSTPRVPVLGPLYRFYFNRVLPRLGRWVSGDAGGAYNYLPESVLQFAERDAFTALMRQAGLTSPRFRLLTGGIAALYRAEVPA